MMAYFEITAPGKETWTVPARKIVLSDGREAYEPIVKVYVGRKGKARLIKDDPAETERTPQP
jgi:hypothetical protein